MEDRDLLELAAKAAGVHAHHWSERHDVLMCSSVEGGDPDYGWNPLTDDGDAARLEAALRLNVLWWEAAVTVDIDHIDCAPVIETYADHGGDRQKARRYAAVRAAAFSRSNA